MFSKSLIFILVGLFGFTQVSAQNNNYLNQNWLLADITYLNSEKLTAIPTKYNTKENVLEIKEGDEITIVPIEKVRNLIFTELDLLLSFSYTEKQLRSASHAQEMANLIRLKKEGVVPTPKDRYLNQSWKVASVTFDNDKTLYSALIKYNLKSKALEIKQMNKTLSLPITRVERFTFVEKNETFVSLRNYDNTTTKFLGLLNLVYSNGAISLAFCHNLKEVSSAGGDIGYGSIENREKTYKTLTEFCFIDANQKLSRVERKAKKNSLFFGKYWEQVSVFIKTEKLSFKTKEEIIKIIDFYSSLLNA